MPSATTASTMAGTKRKAESAKGTHQKKPKITEVVLREKPMKEKKAEEKARKEKNITVITEEKPKKEKKSKKLIVKAPIESDESDESDGGVAIEEEDDDEDDIDEEDEDEDVDEDGDTEMKDGLHPDRVKKVEANSTSSREAHAKQKQLVAERKAAKPLAEQLFQAKKLWERLRRKSHVPLEDRKVLVKELFDIVTGNVKDFVLKHDSGRVIQTAIKYANLEQKKMIANELKGSYRQLAESKYAKFLIGKLLVEGDEEIRDTIVPEFFGHVRKLIKHPEASWILDDIYRGIATKQQKATILREWYGAEFTLFQNSKDQTSGDLSAILEEQPGKRGPIMRSLQELINQLIQKKFTGFTLLHDAMLQYFLNAKQGTEEITDFIELLKGDEEGDLIKNLAFTKSGARVVCLALAYGTAKDRKQILRQFKDTLQLMAGDVNAHTVILAAYEVIDDTVLTAKSIFPELLSKDAEKQVENIVNSANDLNARTTLLYLFEGRTNSLFPSKLSSDLDILKEIDTIRTTTSKKDPEIRRAELAKALSPLLIKGVEAAASELVTTSFGCHFITEVMFGAEGEKLDALTAIAATASGDPSVVAITEGETSTPGHLANLSPYGKMLKGLIAGGPYSREEKKIVQVVPALNFADILYPVIKEEIVAWATGASSFVVLALFESNSFGHLKELKKTLKVHKGELVTASKEETAEQKVKRESTDVKPKNKGKNKKVGQEKAVGNAGSRLILEKL